MAENGKKKGIVGKVVIGVVILAVIGAVASSMGGNEPKVADSSDTAKQEQQSGSSSGGDQGTGGAKQEEKSTENLAIGTPVDLGDGLTVSVDSVERLTDISGATVIKAAVTYKNGGDKTVSYNMYDWKGQDANGAAESSTGYAAPDGTINEGALTSGDLSAGGSKTGNLYFKDGTVKVQYSGITFTKEIKASWNLQ